MKQGIAKAVEELFSKYSGSMKRMKREASNLEGKASRGSKTYRESKEKVKSMWNNSPNAKEAVSSVGKLTGLKLMDSEKRLFAKNLKKIKESEEMIKNIDKLGLSGKARITAIKEAGETIKKLKHSNTMITRGTHVRKGLTAGAMAVGYDMSGDDK